MIGQQIGNYRLVKLLGSGGMGMVYEAVHDGIGGRAAIKVLRPEIALHKEATQRFFSEARAANLISHPGIVHIFDCGYAASGTAYLAMEFLEGESLRQRLERLRTLTVSEAIRIARQVASALHAAHQCGVIHRDLKPDNLMLVQDPELPGGERVKLLDFGVAKIAEGIGAQTKTGTVMGTPAYMSPEQCRDAKLATDRSDVYSLGILLYQTLAGRPPFVGEFIGDVLAMQMMQEPPPLSQFCPRLQRSVVEFVHRLLEKQPAMRPGMAEVMKELQRLLDLVTKSQTQVSAQASVSGPRPSTQPLSSDEIRQLAPTGRRPAVSQPVDEESPTTPAIADRQTEPLSIVHLRNPNPDGGTESDDAPVPPPAPPLPNKTDQPDQQESVAAPAKSSLNVNRPRSASAEQLPNLNAPAQHSVTLATGQRGRLGSPRYWILGVLALTVVVGLSIFATRRTDSDPNSQQLQSVDASAATPPAPMDASLPVDMAAPMPDLLSSPPPARSGPRFVVSDEELLAAQKALTKDSWAEAARHASQCEDRGEAKSKCPWILGMATCQMMRTNVDPRRRQYLDHDLSSALKSLREQNQPQLAKEIERSCASLGVPIVTTKDAPSQSAPLKLRNPFL